MVLFPGLVLPMRVFEPRYQVLMEHLLGQPDGTPREFGVVAIRQGWEVGADGVEALYDVGCTARLRQVVRQEDGTYGIVSVGFERFRLGQVDPDTQPYLQAEIERLPDPVGSVDQARVLAASVAALYLDHLGVLAVTAGHEVGDDVDLPDDPALLSALVASTTPLDLADRQELLAAPDIVTRLRGEIRLLKREATMLRRVHAVPVSLAELRTSSGLN